VTEDTAASPEIHLRNKNLNGTTATSAVDAAISTA